MRVTKNTLATAGLLALMGANASRANDETPAKVKVVGHYDNAIGTSDAASAGTITSDLIANRPALRTGELLEFVPGMIVTQHSGDGKANQYFLRGFNLDHGTDFATYVDGMPVNMRTHAHGHGYSDLNFLIPELVQRISYEKGPYFAGNGDFASAGAARIRLANTLPQGLASLSLGARGYRRAVLADTIDTADGSLLYGLELNRNDGPWDTPERLRKYNAILRYTAGTADAGYTFTGMAYRNRWTATDQIPLRAVDAGVIGRFGSIDPTDGGRSARYSLSYSLHKRGENRLLELDAYLIQSSLDLFSNFHYFLENPERGDQFSQSERRQVAGLNISQSWAGTGLGLPMRNKIGLQTRFDRLSPIGLYSTVAQARIDTVREDRVREGSAGLYAENVMQWRPWFRSIAGVRYDSYRFHVASTLDGNSGRAHEQLFSPKLSIVFGPWNNTEYFINVGKGFHSNDARGTTQTRLPDGGLAVPVTPLVPTKGSELGLRTEMLPGLQSSLVLWQLTIDSELLFVGDAGETAPNRASRRSGIEWNNHYIVAPWLLFDLDFAASRARYSQHDPAGDHIPGSLNRVLSFGATVRDLGRWDANFNLRHFGPRPLNEDNSVRSRSTTLAYARVGYKLRRDTSVTVDVFNLFDKRASDIDYFYPSRLRGEAAGGSDDIHFHPVEPRTLRLTLTHRF